MTTLEYIRMKYRLDLTQQSPIQINGMNRAELATLFNELGYKKGAEIGTLRGEYAEVICKAILGVKLYCVDPYVGYINHTQDDLDKSYIQAKKRLSPYHVQFVKNYSVEASMAFEDNELDFVYIDAAHDFRNVVDDIDSWYPKVRSGGIVSGHDYVRRKKPSKTHIIEAVQGFTRAYNIYPYFITDRPSELKGNKERDMTRSWFWVKQ